MEAFISQIMANPLLEMLTAVVVVEMSVLVSLVGWLGLQTRRQNRHRSLQARFLEEQQDGFFEALALDDVERMDQWHDGLTEFPTEIPRDFLADNILRTSGAFRDRLIWLYRKWGYVQIDHEQLMSRSGRHRMVALRRLYVVAGVEDRELLMKTATSDHFTRILLAQILSRVGEPEDMVTLLSDVELDNGLLQEPIHSALEQLDDVAFEGVFACREQIKAVRIRRILLTMAARRAVDGIEGIVLEASRDFDAEVRIGACDAAVHLHPETGAEILRHAVDDNSWEVRARAAKLLRGYPNLETFEVLVRATRDPSFWVRQNAAASMREMGRGGLLRLEGIAVASDDDFAVDAAIQQLQQAEILANNRRRFQAREAAS